jgi:hypothetical protein
MGTIRSLDRVPRQRACGCCIQEVLLLLERWTALVFIQNLGFWPYSAIDVYRESILRVASKKALQGERTGTVSVTLVST